jgi:hypothetical protein
MIREFKLVRGPSREELFDSLRLGLRYLDLRDVEFIGEHPNKSGEEDIPLYFSIEIQGLHHVDLGGGNYFFHGKRRFTPLRGEAQGAPDFKFAFGRWNTHSRTGRIRVGETSFFVSPWHE